MYERLPAIKVRIVDLVNGNFVKGSKEELTPSYLITPFGEKISRVNIVGIIIEKFVNENEDYVSIILDDGSDRIRVKGFKEDASLFSGIEKGDLVLVIGKVKEFLDEIYINAEIVRKVDSYVELLRKVELLKKLSKKKEMVENIKKISGSLEEEEVINYARDNYGIDEEIVRYILKSKNLEVDYKPRVLEVIKNLDKGDGVEVSKLFEILNLPERIIENTIDELLSSGELFEPSLGKVKIVSS